MGIGQVDDRSGLSWHGYSWRRYKASHAHAARAKNKRLRSFLLCILTIFAAMAATCACSIMALPTAAPSKLERTAFTGTAVQGLPALRTISKAPGALRVEARTRKVIPKEPFGPSGGVKFDKGVDANGRVAKGKGVYQFAKKYGANVDGYSPIYDKEEWSRSGDVYVGGQSGLALWAALLGALLIGGALLVYNTSALAP